jgi:hypothetical protein
VNDLERMSNSIGETLCHLEMVFPPAFFYIMMHLLVHLAEEAKLGGPCAIDGCTQLRDIYGLLKAMFATKVTLKVQLQRDIY